MSIFAIVLLLAMDHIQMNMARLCGPNEHGISCAPLLSCQPTCDKPDGRPCPRMCDAKGCVCNEGFVRDNYNDLQCIRSSECSQKMTTTASTCGPNEIKTECAMLQQCQPSCDYPVGTPCALICSLNSCECKEGFVRRSKDDLTCIEKSQCNVTEVLVCGENEELVECVNPCQPSCENPDRHPCFSLQCASGCACRSGYMRETNDSNSPCIQCPIILN